MTHLMLMAMATLVVVMVGAEQVQTGAKPCQICNPNPYAASCDALSPPAGVSLNASFCTVMETKFKDEHDKLCKKYPPPDGYQVQCTVPGTSNTFSCSSSCGKLDGNMNLNLNLLQGGGLTLPNRFNNRQGSRAGNLFGNTNKAGKSGGLLDFGNFGMLNNFGNFDNLNLNNQNNRLNAAKAAAGNVQNTAFTQGQNSNTFGSSAKSGAGSTSNAGKNTVGRTGSTSSHSSSSSTFRNGASDGFNKNTNNVYNANTGNQAGSIATGGSYPQGPPPINAVPPSVPPYVAGPSQAVPLGDGLGRTGVNVPLNTYPNGVAGLPSARYKIPKESAPTQDHVPSSPSASSSSSSSSSSPSLPKGPTPVKDNNHKKNLPTDAFQGPFQASPLGGGGGFGGNSVFGGSPLFSQGFSDFSRPSQPSQAGGFGRPGGMGALDFGGRKPFSGFGSLGKSGFGSFGNNDQFQFPGYFEDFGNRGK